MNNIYVSLNCICLGNCICVEKNHVWVSEKYIVTFTRKTIKSHLCCQKVCLYWIFASVQSIICWQMHTPIRNCRWLKVLSLMETLQSYDTGRHRHQQTLHWHIVHRHQKDWLPSSWLIGILFNYILYLIVKSFCKPTWWIVIRLI